MKDLWNPVTRQSAFKRLMKFSVVFGIFVSGIFLIAWLGRFWEEGRIVPIGDFFRF